LQVAGPKSVECAVLEASRVIEILVEFRRERERAMAAL
jgi:hypothetical protein